MMIKVMLVMMFMFLVGCTTTHKETTDIEAKVLNVTKSEGFGIVPSMIVTTDKGMFNIRSRRFISNTVLIHKVDTVDINGDILYTDVDIVNKY